MRASRSSRANRAFALVIHHLSSGDCADMVDDGDYTLLVNKYIECGHLEVNDWLEAAAPYAATGLKSRSYVPHVLTLVQLADAMIALYE